MARWRSVGIERQFRPQQSLGKQAVQSMRRKLRVLLAEGIPGQMSHRAAPAQRKTQASSRRHDPQRAQAHRLRCWVGIVHGVRLPRLNRLGKFQNCDEGWNHKLMDRNDARTDEIRVRSLVETAFPHLSGGETKPRVLHPGTEKMIDRSATNPDTRPMKISCSTARFACPGRTPRVLKKSHPLNWWAHLLPTR